MIRTRPMLVVAVLAVAVVLALAYWPGAEQPVPKAPHSDLLPHGGSAKTSERRRSAPAPGKPQYTESELRELRPKLLQLSTIEFKAPGEIEFACGLIARYSGDPTVAVTALRRAREAESSEAIVSICRALGPTWMSHIRRYRERMLDIVVGLPAEMEVSDGILILLKSEKEQRALMSAAASIQMRGTMVHRQQELRAISSRIQDATLREQVDRLID